MSLGGLLLTAADRAREVDAANRVAATVCVRRILTAGPTDPEELCPMHITLRVNDQPHDLDVEPRRLLVHAIRDDVGLTATNVGCDTSSCGACTVLVDGESVKSCTVLAVQADGCEVTTVEALATDGTLHPLQEAFTRHHALQCGFCTPGMVMAALALVDEDPDLDDRAVRLGLEGNICRCTGYHNIVDAVLDYARSKQ